MRGSLVAIVAFGCSTPPHAPGTAAGRFTSRPVDADAIRKACAMEVSCFAEPPFPRGGSCVEQLEQGLASGVGVAFDISFGVGDGPSADDLERYIACASTAPDCATVLACASTDHGTDWCAAHPSYGCDGDVRIGCDGGWGLEQTDCAALGLHCAEANNTAVCTDGTTCDASLPRCDGDRYMFCDAMTDLEIAEDCSAFGESCVADGCKAVGSQSSCDVSDRCDGTTAVVCIDGVAIREDCTQFASHCETRAPSDGFTGASCVSDATDCAPETSDSCDGDTLRICVDGEIVDTACSSIGLSTCQAAGSDAKCN